MKIKKMDENKDILIILYYRFWGIIEIFFEFYKLRSIK